MLCNRCGQKPAQKKVKREGGEPLFLCNDCFKALQAERAADACPQCGTTLQEFRSSGLFGCAYCYTHFRGEIMPFLSRIQAGVSHEGTLPAANSREHYEETRGLIERHSAVKARLEEALRNGDFATAKRLQQELEELHRRLYAGGENR